MLKTFLYFSAKWFFFFKLFIVAIITLTSDFGNTDYYSAILKASIVGATQQARIVDISHNVESFDIVQAAFLLKNSFGYFPMATCHIGAINLYYAAKNEMICFQRNGHFFIGPNNGLFTLIFPDLQDREVFTIRYASLQKMEAYQAIATFSRAIEQKIPFDEIAHHGARLAKGFTVQPVISENSIRATIVHIDHYENVIVNVTKDVFNRVRKNREFSIFYNPGSPVNHISDSYSDVPVGEVLCMFNTSGYLEIAINLGKASSLLGLKKDETIHIDFLGYAI